MECFRGRCSSSCYHSQDIENHGQRGLARRSLVAICDRGASRRCWRPLAHTPWCQRGSRARWNSLQAEVRANFNKKVHIPHWHRNESEARQYYFRINYPQNYESESERKFGVGGGSMKFTLNWLSCQKIIGINKLSFKKRKRKRKNMSEELISL